MSKLASTPLDRSNPMWQMHLAERYGKGSVLIARFHHCYADGMALLAIFATLTDPLTDAAAAVEPIAATEHDPMWRSLPFAATAVATVARVQGVGQSALDLLGSSLHAIAHPEQTLAATKELGAAAAEIAAITLLPDDPRGPLKGRLGRRKQVAWAKPLPLREIKTK